MAPLQGKDLGKVDASDVTQEMIDAGVEQFLRDYPETGAGDELDRRMVRRIFEAMASVGVSGKFAPLHKTA